MLITITPPFMTTTLIKKRGHVLYLVLIQKKHGVYLSVSIWHLPPSTVPYNYIYRRLNLKVLFQIKIDKNDYIFLAVNTVFKI